MLVSNAKVFLEIDGVDLSSCVMALECKRGEGLGPLVDYKTEVKLLCTDQSVEVAKAAAMLGRAYVRLKGGGNLEGEAAVVECSINASVDALAEIRMRFIHRRAQAARPLYDSTLYAIRLECLLGASSKFWQVQVSRETAEPSVTVLVKWGRIGTEGGEQKKLFPTKKLALAFVADKVREKFAKGYVEVADPIRPAAMTGEPLEVTSMGDTGRRFISGPEKLAELSEQITRGFRDEVFVPTKRSQPARKKVAAVDPAEQPVRRIRLEDD